MQLFDEIIFWLSGGLMIPVVLGVLYLLITGLLSIGKFYGLYFNRSKYNKLLKENLNPKQLDLEKITQADSTSKTLLGSAMAEIIEAKHSEIIREKIIADFEVACERELDKHRTLAKMGPILGLMGTLIPMGPALGGLSEGDITTMSEQMQIAFNTTVLGLVIGCIGFLLLQTKQRWFTQDLNQLDFLNNLIAENYEKDTK
ncbi:MAG: MotA/TolQ/ExbB proton channel family protein [Flavobacteriaceae bacterium]